MEKQANAVREYTWCPRAYYLSHEAGIEPTTVPLRSWLDSLLKETVFEIITRFMGKCGYRHEDTFYRQWKEKVKNVPANIHLNARENPKKTINEITAQAMNFYKLAHSGIMPHWKIVAVEAPFFETFGGVVLNHSIDIVGKAGGRDDIMIVDLHKNPPSDFFLRSSIWEWLQVYGYRKLFRKLEQNAFLISIKSDDATVSTVPLPKPTQREMTKMTNEIGAICAHLRADVESGSWCPNYTWYCEKQCGYLDICEGMGKDEPARTSTP